MRMHDLNTGAFRLPQDQRAPDINIIAEKCAFEGFTRFEDRFKMPLGISINYTSYAAKLLAEVSKHAATVSIQT